SRRTCFDAIEIDPQPGSVFLLLGIRLRIATLRLNGVCLLLGIGRRDRDRVILRRKRVLHILAQGQSINGALAGGGEIELEPAQYRGELTVTDVVKIVALGVPSRGVLVEDLTSNAVGLLVGSAPDPDGTVAVLA